MRTPEAEAEALFEEARERARKRRRHRLSVVAALAVGAALAAVIVAGDTTQTGSRIHPDVGRGARPTVPTRLYVQLLTRTEPLAVVDATTGRFRLLQLPTAGGDWLERLDRTGDHLVWVATGGTYVVESNLQGRPQKLASSYFLPSTSAGRIWVLSPDHHRPHTRRPRLSAVEMTVRGRVKRRVLVQPPCRGAVVAAVDRALLCQDRADGLLAVAVSSGKVRARLPGAFPFGTHGSVVASCDSACRRVEVADLATGRRSAVAPPKGARYVGGYDGAFSPDGAVLAVPVATPNHDAEHGPPGSLQVALVDLRRNSARLIAGSRLAADYRKLTWSSGRELFFGSGRGRIMSYRVGWPRARLLPVKLGAPILDLAAN